MLKRNNLFQFIVYSILFLILSCSKKAIHHSTYKVGENSKSEKKLEIPSLPIFIQKMNEKDTIVEGLHVIFSFQRTACFGFCPTFEFNLYSNGVACFYGKQNTRIEGKIFGLLSELQWNELKTKASQINFDKLEERYPKEKREVIPDLPLVITGINYTGQFKLVTNSHSAPTELKEYETYIQTLIEEFVEKNLVKKN